MPRGRAIVFVICVTCVRWIPQIVEYLKGKRWKRVAGKGHNYFSRADFRAINVLAPRGNEFCDDGARERHFISTTDSAQGVLINALATYSNPLLW